MSKSIKNRGKSVTAAGTGINLALGVLYTWSIFKGSIKESIERGGENAFNWEMASLNDPYAVCILVFACTMIVAGKCQDRFGPRITAFIGGILVGLGFILLSQTNSYLGWILGFGILVGGGIAFGYSAATPAALKWFPPNKTGIIAGVVVSGFGLASVYIAPLATYLLNGWGLSFAMLFFGIAFFLVVGIFSQFLANPPADFNPVDFVDRRRSCEVNSERREQFQEVNATPGEMLRTPEFWGVWVLYFIGAGAGLMVIGSVAGMAKQSLGANAFVAVAILAIGNAAGRIAAGGLSDRIGRRPTLAGMFIFQAVLMLAAVPVVGSADSSALLLVLVATFIGFNYGANLALFPSFTKDLWGIRNFGVNYGLVFTAWGLGGFVLSRVSQTIFAESGSYQGSFVTAAALLVVGAVVVFFVHDHRHEQKKTLEGAIEPTADPNQVKA